MAASKKKKKKSMPKRRSAVTEWMWIHCKADPFRDRRFRRVRTRATKKAKALQLDQS